MPAFSMPNHIVSDLRSANVPNRSNGEKYIPVEEEDDDLLQVQCPLYTSPVSLKIHLYCSVLSWQFGPTLLNVSLSTKFLW